MTKLSKGSSANQRFFAFTPNQSEKESKDNKNNDATQKIIYHDLKFVYNTIQKSKDIGYEIKGTSNKAEDSNQKKEKGKVIVVVLNNTLAKYAYDIIAGADFVVCADGGANRLYDLTIEMQKKMRKEINKNEEERNIDLPAQEKKPSYISNKENANYVDSINSSRVFNILPNLLPNLICGDFDSITEKTYNFYKQKGIVQIIQDTNVSNTDLDKCIEKIKTQINKNDKIIVLGATGNRFDHTCGNISTLYRNASVYHIYLLGEDNFLFVLKKGHHVIKADLRVFEKNCGLLPIGNSSKVTTNGLKYDMLDTHLNFDSLISSSNEFITDEAHVFNTTPVLWFSQIKKTIC